jgi:hypothetical protein
MIAKWILLRRAALAHAIAQDEILKNSFADGTRRMPSDGALGRSQGAADPANCCTHPIVLAGRLLYESVQ